MSNTAFFFRSTGILLVLAVVVCGFRGHAAEQTGTTDPLALYREAGASADQEGKIRLLASEYEKSARVRLQRIRNLSAQLKEASFEPELDEKKILGLQEEMNTLHTGLCMDRIKLMLSIRQVLEPEQRVKLVGLMKEKGLGATDTPR